MDNLISITCLWAKAKFIVHEAKCKSWETFFSSTHSNVWKKLWCMSGKCSVTSIPGISVGGDTIRSQVTANTPGAHFTSCHALSSGNYNPFKLMKENTEALPLNFASWLTELYNSEFCMEELLAVLHSCQTMTPGPNGIHNQMLSHLSPTCKEFLLSMYNRISSENSVPAAWR
jgi:hypothetical protein